VVFQPLVVAIFMAAALWPWVSRWVLAQATYAGISAAVMAAGLWIMRIPDPWLYGVLSAVLALLPGLGPAFAAVPAIVVALDLASWQPVGVFLFGVVVYILDGALFVPRIYGSVMRLPMFVVLVATLLGADLMGAMIASPVAVALRIILRDQFRRRLDSGSPT